MNKNKKQTAQKLWKRALKVIPTGNMLLSKNPNRFLPGKWPTYYSKSKGVNIWDLKGTNSSKGPSKTMRHQWS